MQRTSVARSLSFLREHTGDDELTLIGRALDIGLFQLTVQVAEQAFVDGGMTREQAVQVLGIDRVRDLEYAKRALAEDVERGLGQHKTLRERLIEGYQVNAEADQKLAEEW